VETGIGKSAPVGPFRRASLYQCIWEFKTLLYNQVCGEKSLFQVFNYELARVKSNMAEWHYVLGPNVKVTYSGIKMPTTFQCTKNLTKGHPNQMISIL
jgi:hypothetical protein